VSLHLEARVGDIAPIVLLPGDPLRAKFIAERFLTEPVQHNQVRNAFGYTGRYRDQRISVQSTGMGMPSASIYIHELLTGYDAKVLIRIGTCGALQRDLQLGDLVLAISASTDSAINKHAFGGMDYAATADFELLRRAYELSERKPRVGPVLTSDTFYTERDDVYAIWQRHGVLAAEMETAALYTLAARFGARALSILTVSDSIVTGEHASAEERQTGYARMVQLALDVATS
jgi:purine-nucleoside phosphorylase